jgi:hypothetical protein
MMEGDIYKGMRGKQGRGQEGNGKETSIRVDRENWMRTMNLDGDDDRNDIRTI